MKSKFQIFVSSTYEDLVSERDIVIKAILEIGHIPVGMEMFSAADQEQWELIKRQIDDCDYYVAVLAHRYGSRDRTISYTEKEYDYAASKSIPVLGFVIDDSADWPRNMMDSDASDQLSLIAFKTKVKQKTVSFWKNADDLHGRVAIALSKAFNTHPRPGWIRATEDIGASVTNELSRLSEENARLRVDLATAVAAAKQDEVNQIRKTLQILLAREAKISLWLNGDTKFTSHEPTTLSTIFYRIAPFLLVEHSEVKLNEILAYILLDRKQHPGRTLRSHSALPLNKVSEWLGDLMTLEIIEPSTKRHAVSDQNKYWKLSKYGVDVYKFIRMQILSGEMSPIGSPSDPEQLTNSPSGREDGVSD